MGTALVILGVFTMVVLVPLWMSHGTVATRNNQIGLIRQNLTGAAITGVVPPGSKVTAFWPFWAGELLDIEEFNKNFTPEVTVISALTGNPVKMKTEEASLGYCYDPSTPARAGRFTVLVKRKDGKWDNNALEERIKDCLQSALNDYCGSNDPRVLGKTDNEMRNLTEKELQVVQEIMQKRIDAENLPIRITTFTLSKPFVDPLMQGLFDAEAEQQKQLGIDALRHKRLLAAAENRAIINQVVDKRYEEIVARLERAYGPAAWAGFSPEDKRKAVADALESDSRQELYRELGDHGGNLDLHSIPGSGGGKRNNNNQGGGGRNPRR